MTIEDLIKLLLDYPPDMEVVCLDDEIGYTYEPTLRLGKIQKQLGFGSGFFIFCEDGDSIAID